MSVHEGFRQGAVFLSENEWSPTTKLGERVPVGTVFFVTMNLDPDADFNAPTSHVIYGVTAKHNLADYDENRTLYLIANKADGSGYKSIPTRVGDWTKHPETDVAVCELSPLAEDEITGSSTPFPWLLQKNKVTRHYSVVRLGDEVFTVGMYVGFHGARSIQPIVRYGHISLMPNEDEKLKVAMCEADEHAKYEDLPEIEAYLTELNGWEGQSGSPVFASFGRRIEQVELLPMSMPTDEMKQIIPVPGDGPNVYDFDIGKRHLVFRHEPVCIGLVQGYYPDEKVEKQGRKHVRWRVNLGISIVVPSDKIIETLMDGELEKERERRRRRPRSGQLRPTAS